MTKKILEKQQNLKSDGNVIPIFFASDDNYLPYLSVAIRSLIDNASKDYHYIIHILNVGVDKEKAKSITKMQNENFEILFNDVSKKVQPFADELDMQNNLHYITIAAYYRLFIASLFKEYDKALYLDCDIVVLGDISKLYNTELDDNILGAIQCQIVSSRKIFREYAQKVIGVNHLNYFNSGILVMNLKEYRKKNIEKTFLNIIKKYHFEFLAYDQDYLNFLCKNKVKMLDLGWNKAAVRDGYNKKPELVHYAFFKKPWTDYGVKFEKYFWKYAKEVDFYEYIVNFRKNYKVSQRIANFNHAQKLEKKAKILIKSDKNIHRVLEAPFIEKNEEIEFQGEEDLFNLNKGVSDAGSKLVTGSN